MTPGRDAHFLHAQRALEPVLAAPVEAPRAIAWIPGKEVLLVAAANGAVIAVEPSFGSRTLWTGAPDPVCLAADTERVAVLNIHGVLQVWRRGESVPDHQIDTALRGDSDVLFAGPRVAVVGEGPGGRRVRVYAGADLELDALVPPGTALGVNAEGGLWLGRSLQTGVVTGPLGSPIPSGPATGHFLHATAGRLLGVAVGGATVWEDGVPLTVRLLDTSAAALSVDGQSAALGTFGGLVAICPLTAAPALRAHPPRVSAHDSAVRALSFADRGRWLATVGENCRLWAW